MMMIIVMLRYSGIEVNIWDIVPKLNKNKSNNSVNKKKQFFKNLNLRKLIN
jgi:hypothetical protein